MAERAMKYKVVIERDGSGSWIARVPSVKGCHSYGRTLEQARESVREALHLWVDDAERAELFYDIRLPQTVTARIESFHKLRREHDHIQRETQASLLVAARALTKEAGLSLRDAADLLDLSHQRVAQVLESKRR